MGLEFAGCVYVGFFSTEIQGSVDIYFSCHRFLKLKVITFIIGGVTHMCDVAITFLNILPSLVINNE